MTKCTESGCRNLETKCIDCGRLVSDCKFPNEIGRIEINEYHAGMRWISVEETLPKHDEYVLAYSDDVYILKFHITNDKRRKHQNWYFEDTTGGSNDWAEVKAWMPLPKHPM